MEQTPTRGGRSALRNAATSERLGSNVAYNAMIVGVSFVTSTLVAFLVPRLLGPPRYGVYQLAFQSAMIFQALATLGVPATLLRYVAEQTGSGKLETAHDITVAVLRWQSLIGAGVMLRLEKLT